MLLRELGREVVSDPVLVRELDWELTRVVVSGPVLV